MNTLSIGSLARNTFTFCCTKCFFLVLVLGASMTIGLEALPVLPRDAIITVGHSPVTQQQRSVFLSDPPPSVPAPVPLTDNQRSNSTSAKLSRGGRFSAVFCRPRWTDSPWKWTTLGCWSVAVIQMLLPQVQRNRSWCIVTAGMWVRQDLTWVYVMWFYRWDETVKKYKYLSNHNY